MTNSGQLVFGVYPGQVVTVTSPNAYKDNVWHHVVATLGSGGMALYVDGALVASSTAATTAQGYAGYWRIGGDNLNGWPNKPTNAAFKGSVDEVAVYPTALTAAQVANHYNLGR
jgi:hypothetical protein